MQNTGRTESQGSARGPEVDLLTLGDAKMKCRRRPKPQLATAMLLGGVFLFSAVHASEGPSRAKSRALDSDESVYHKRLRRRRSENAFPLDEYETSAPAAPSGVPYEDARNKYKIDDALLEANESLQETAADNGGQSEWMPDPRIINGVSAPETRYPYAASLQYNRQHFCGGSLVSPNIVITAAHCTSTPGKVTLGRYDLDSVDDYDYEVLDVTSKIVHPAYDKTVVENDLALLVLEKDSVHPYIRINADVNVPVNGEELAVMGWGDIDPSENGQETSDELRETGVWYMPNGVCEESEGYVKTNEGVLFGSYEGSITTSMMCAIDNVGTTSDACQGDSGGGLVSTGSDSSADVLVGLVSWGFGCADPNFPGVYSRLSAYYDDFLRPALCQYSRTPPSYLNCDPGSGISEPVSTPAPVPTPDGLLTIFIDTDPFTPEDLGWELTSVPGGKLIASRPIGYYSNKYRTTLSEEVIVDPENFYRFTIFDRDRDGFRGEVAVVRGRKNVKSSALVYEPGFSKVSGGSVVHGFYVGDSPPRVLTLDLTFDRNPQELAWSVTNVEDDLPLGFKWFDWYGKDFIKATETIPIYGNERGTQQYVFTILDLNGNGMCCRQGQGSFSLYLGDSGSGSTIASGGEFTTDQSFQFGVNSAGLVTAPAPPSPTSPSDPGYYMVPATGLCQVNDQSRPSWVLQVHASHEECCSFSWNPNQCAASKPVEDGASPPTNRPTASNPVAVSPPGSGSMPPPASSDAPPPAISDTNGSTITFAPVTGSFTCKSAGMSCTIKSAELGTIKRVASGMAAEKQNDSTIVYTTERGTDYYPDDPSRLILVESDSSAGSIISCDEGCTCKSVNDNVLGCGLVANPTGVQVVPAPSPSSPLQPSASVNGSSPTRRLSLLWLPGMLLLWGVLR